MRLGGPNSWRCSTCSGTGKVAGRTRQPANSCDSCGGSGRVFRFGGPNSSGACDVCAGTGRGRRSTSSRQIAPEEIPSLAAEIAKLAKLHVLGALTDEEFQRAKAKLLE
jgi:hypothetical protein